MVFSSLKFVCVFLPVFFLCYYSTPQKWRNFILLSGSLCFYFIGTLTAPWQFVLLVLNIIGDFLFGRWMVRYPTRKKAFLIFGVALHLLCLCLFKYMGFIFCELSSLIPGFEVSWDILLPVGISFYTFQGITYLADVYRGDTPAEESLLKFSVYVSMFPQLVAGPIVNYGQVRTALHDRTVTRQMVETGFGTFVFGLGMKVLLANPLGKLWTQAGTIGFESLSTPLAWMSIFAYSLQLYFDFFGYSLMSVGLGQMLGFQLPQNFDHPYTSRTMTEFWRRWHMTLSFWFRNYVYIPLGGNRNGRWRTVRNLCIVWLLTGIWHGVGYHFILWGVVLFLILLTEKFFTGKFLSTHPVAGHLYMIFLIPLSWAVFAVEDFGQLGVLFTRLFPFFGQGVWSIFRYDYLKYLKEYYPFFLVGIFFSTRLPYRLLKMIKYRILIGCLLLTILGVSIYCMYRGLDDPFMYFRF